MKIQIILGSTRPGRMGERVARWVERKAAHNEAFKPQLLDLKDYQLPMFDEPVSPRYNPNRQLEGDVKRWLETLAQADGYVIVTPEYNHSVSGVLKNALDYIDFQFAKKPAAIVSYGTVGGARAAEHLKGILNEVKAAVVPEAIALSHPQAHLDEHGAYIGDQAQPYNPDAQLDIVLDELAWWTKTLKSGRTSVEK